MVKLLSCFRPDGSKRAVWSDMNAQVFRDAGVIPQRASRVEVITEGVHRGRFHVDFTLLAEATGDPTYAACLVTPFDSYTDAVAAEVAWLEKNFVLPPAGG